MRGLRAFAVLGCLALAGLSPLEAAAKDALAGVQALPVASTTVRAAAVAALLLGALFHFWRRLRREAKPQRGTPTPMSEIDADWLERHVFSMSPELVGAAYDRRIAGPEVAAVLARMCGEAKLASRVAGGTRGWNNLELWLLVEREELTGYERELVDSLFRSRKTTSADAIQQEYGPVGFEPAVILRRHLSAACDATLGIRRPMLPRPLGMALGAAASAAALGFLIAATALPPLAPLGIAAVGLLGAALFARAAASRESAEGLALRRNLLAARGFFAAELERPEPRIQDEWLPYLIALELTTEVDRWFQAFGRIETAARKHSLAQPAESGERATSASLWTGGAGALGGIGASGPWIAATAGLAVVPRREREGFGSQRGLLELGSAARQPSAFGAVASR